MPQKVMRKLASFIKYSSFLESQLLDGLLGMLTYKAVNRLSVGLTLQQPLCSTIVETLLIKHQFYFSSFSSNCPMPWSYGP